MAKDIKDWTKQIEGLGEMDLDGVTNLYSEMLATAHDIGYKVPDEQLIETEDPDQLRAVIPPLHEGIISFNAAQKAALKEKTDAAPAAKKTKKTAPTKADAAKPVKKTVAKKPGKPPAQKDVSKETEMATATAKKAAAPKKAAKAAKTAKKAGKKAATANARKAAGGGAGRFAGTETISVKFKDIPGRSGSAVYDRLANLQKYNGKTVDAFLKSSLGRTSTLHKAVAKGWITVK